MAALSPTRTASSYTTLWDTINNTQTCVNNGGVRLLVSLVHQQVTVRQALLRSDKLSDLSTE
jgi:hypothetical protein